MPPQTPNTQTPQPPVAQQITPPPPTTTVSPQPPVVNGVESPKKSVPKWVWIVGGVVGAIVVFIIVVSVWVGAATKAPQKVGDQFVNDIQSGDASAAYELTSQSFRDVTSQEGLDQLIKQVGPSLQGEEKITGRSIQKASGIAETAILVYQVKTSNGTNYMKVELQKTGEEWKVVNFRSDNKPLDTSIE